MKTYTETTERILEKSAAVGARRAKQRRIAAGAGTAFCCAALCAVGFAMHRPPVIGIDPIPEITSEAPADAPVTEIAPDNLPQGGTVTTAAVVHEPPVVSSGTAIAVPPAASSAGTGISTSPAVPPMTEIAPEQPTVTSTSASGGHLMAVGNEICLRLDWFRPMTRAEELAFYGLSEELGTQLGLTAGWSVNDVYGWYDNPDYGEYYAEAIRWGDGDRYLSIRPLHSRLPLADCVVVGALPPAFTVADGNAEIAVYEDTSWNGAPYYWTHFLHEGIGYDIAAQHLTEAEFRLVLAAILG